MIDEMTKKGVGGKSGLGFHDKKWAYLTSEDKKDSTDLADKKETIK
jgi:hypothetical protein